MVHQLITEIAREKLPYKLLNWLVASGAALFLMRWGFRLFLRSTDIDCGYNWSFDGTLETARNLRPNFDLRNRSKSRIYRVANIGYKLRGKVHWFDNHSLWGKELKPGSIEFFNDIAPVPKINSIQECTDTSICIRFQDNHEVLAYGPGQMQPKWRKRMSDLRAWLDKLSISPEG